ncbi:hypothetical protein P8452_51644 [Trifolium repens]|nr:hypothetical protein P8452_51642 [Trifolium repens]WJX67151.1 hypothetical protein P8452_51644 [Trifolium repens]
MLLETGQLPSRGKLYIETHKKKDGSFVNDAAKTIVEQIEEGLAQSTNNESESTSLTLVAKNYRLYKTYIATPETNSFLQQGNDGPNHPNTNSPSDANLPN